MRKRILAICALSFIGMGTMLEDAVGRITEQVADYFGNR
jgi:hypothetical protein